MNTITISASEFRANQNRYFDLAETNTVLVTRVGKRPIKLSMVEEAFTKEELQAIKEGFQQIKEGKSIKIDENNLWESIL